MNHYFVKRFGSRSGFSLVEMLIAIGVLMIVSLGVGWMFISSLRASRTIGDQLDAQHDSRRAIESIVNEVRRAEYSSIGAYPIATAATNTLTVYSNVDADGYRERLRYFLDGTVLKKGVTKPSGSPLQYVSSSEAVSELAQDVVNAIVGAPVFL